METLKVKVGEVFSFELEVNKTTGSTWALSKLPDGLLYFEENYVSLNTHLCGAPGKSIFYFKAKKKLDDELVLEYCRSWENEEPAKIAKYQIIAE